MIARFRYRAVRLLPWVIMIAGVCLLVTGIMPVIDAYRGQEAGDDPAVADSAVRGTLESPRYPVIPGEEAVPSRGSPSNPSPSLRPHPSRSFANLTIRRLHKSLRIFRASKDDDFRFGPGLLAGYAEPGETGNAVIAGHRDLHFRVLKDVRVGDELNVTFEGKQFSYRVFAVEIVQPEDVAALRPIARRQLTLVTCFPFAYIGPAPRRLLVKAALSTQPNS